MDTCRCGHPKDAIVPHPCHWVGPGGMCGGPATRRFYAQPGRPASLAGVQMKAPVAPQVVVNDTFACDEHWKVFQGMLKERETKVKADHGSK